MKLPAAVRVVEVGPRDGLQNEARPVSTEHKIALVRALAAAGCPEIEATSFVHPGRVPQLADAEAVLAGIGELPGCRLSALVPNERGLDRALAAGISRIALFTAASDTFCVRNIGMTAAESLAVFRRVAARALAAGISVRGYVSTAFVCPFEGDVPPERAAAAAEALLALGADEVSLGDTVGAAAPTDVERLLESVLARLPAAAVAMHFHDTAGTALANALTALQAGITVFDSAAGGLGGCPFAPGAAGNLATEDLLYLLHRMGVRTGIDLESVARAAAPLEALLGHPLPGRQYRRLRGRD